ncbi:hypothetical protein C8J57DRAFT_1322588, partial [Mycena rebaudengoi]
MIMTLGQLIVRAVEEKPSLQCRASGYQAPSVHSVWAQIIARRFRTETAYLPGLSAGVSSRSHPPSFNCHQIFRGVISAFELGSSIIVAPHPFFFCSVCVSAFFCRGDLSRRQRCLYLSCVHIISDPAYLQRRSLKHRFYYPKYHTRPQHPPGTAHVTSI